MVALALSSSSPSPISGGVRVAARSPRNSSEASRAPQHRVAPSVTSISGKQMRQSSQFSGQLSVAHRTDVADRIVAFLRARYPAKTAENVAADIGGAPGTIQKLIDRGSAPSALLFTRLVCAYGASFLRAAIETPPDWVVVAAREQELADLRAEQARIARKLEALGA